MEEKRELKRCLVCEDSLTITMTYRKLSEKVVFQRGEVAAVDMRRLWSKDSYSCNVCSVDQGTRTVLGVGSL